jgi:sulfur-oxidizing protein SoxY
MTDTREESIDAPAMGRRPVLMALVTLGVACVAAPVAAAAGTLGASAPAEAQSQTLGLQEKVEDALKRLFGTRPMKDGSSMVKLDVPLIAENGAVVPVSVDVNAPMTPASYVKHIYIVGDRNRIPIVTRVAFTPEAGHAFMGANIRLGETGDVRAIVEQSDGTLWQVKRAVKVTVGGCGG